MRWILRQLLFHFTAILLTRLCIPGFTVGNSIESLGLATLGLSVINVFVKPIVKILFLPLNIVTLNLFSILINIGLVFALTKLVPTVTISSWEFGGVNAYGFVIPGFTFTVSYTYLAVSILITTIVNFLNWLIK